MLKPISPKINPLDLEWVSGVRERVRITAMRIREHSELAAQAMSCTPRQTFQFETDLDQIHCAIPELCLLLGPGESLVATRRLS
jgi:hypothetical protein